MKPPTAPGSLPLIGHTLSILRHRLHYITTLPAHGDVVRVDLGPLPLYVVTDPDLTHKVFVNDRVFDKGGILFDGFTEAIGNGMGTCPYSEHRRQRRLAQPAFAKPQLARYASIMQEEIETCIAAWHQGHIVDIRAHTQLFAARVAFLTMLATLRGTDTLTQAIADFDTLRAHLLNRAILPPFVRKIPYPASRAYNTARMRLRQLIDSVVSAYRTTGTDRGDLLSCLIAARDAEGDGEGMTDQEVHDQAIAFFVASIETSSATLAWALYETARHPEVEQRLHREVDAVLGGRTPSLDDLPHLPYTNQIITETLRIHPPAWIVTRITRAPTALAGYSIPAGTNIVLSAQLLHHRPDLHPDPYRFDPDRWDPGRVDRPHRHAMIPFSAGPRKCMGDTFAVIQMNLGLATIAGRWRLTNTPRTQPRSRVAATVSPQNILMRLHRRRAG